MRAPLFPETYHRTAYRGAEKRGAVISCAPPANRRLNLRIRISAFVEFPICRPAPDRPPTHRPRLTRRASLISLPVFRRNPVANSRQRRRKAWRRTGVDGPAGQSPKPRNPNFQILEIFSGKSRIRRAARYRPPLAHITPRTSAPACRPGLPISGPRFRPKPPQKQPEAASKHARPQACIPPKPTVAEPPKSELRAFRSAPVQIDNSTGSPESVNLRTVRPRDLAAGRPA